ncbi:MAG: TonB family protein [Pseudomonadota bacterium]
MRASSLRFLVALPFALIATAGGATTASLPKPVLPVAENDTTRADKAADEPPSVEIADEDRPSFPGNTVNPSSNRDTKPISRFPPQFPVECLDTAAPKEIVSIEFDIAPDGSTANVRVVDTTNACLNAQAVLSVERWRYLPATDSDGKPVWRRGIQTTITFELME